METFILNAYNCSLELYKTKHNEKKMAICCFCLKYGLNLLSNLRMKVILALAVTVALLAVVEGRMWICVFLMICFPHDICFFRFWFSLKVLSQERRWWFQRVSIVFVFIKSKELEFYERKILPVVFHSFLKHYWQWKDFEQQLFVNANFKTFLLNCVTEFHGEDHVESHRVLGR